MCVFCLRVCFAFWPYAFYTQSSILWGFKPGVYLAFWPCTASGLRPMHRPKFMHRNSSKGIHHKDSRLSHHPKLNETPRGHLGSCEGCGRQLNLHRIRTGMLTTTGLQYTPKLLVIEWSFQQYSSQHPMMAISRKTLTANYLDPKWTLKSWPRLKTFKSSPKGHCFPYTLRIHELTLKGLKFLSQGCCIAPPAPHRAPPPHPGAASPAASTTLGRGSGFSIGFDVCCGA